MVNTIPMGSRAAINGTLGWWRSDAASVKYNFTARAKTHGVILASSAATKRQDDVVGLSNLAVRAALKGLA